MRTVLSPAMRKVHQRELFGGLWVDISVKTLTQRRRHSRRACFPDQGKGGPPRGAAGTPWRLGRSCHPTQLALQRRCGAATRPRRGCARCSAPMPPTRRAQPLPDACARGAVARGEAKAGGHPGVDRARGPRRPRLGWAVSEKARVVTGRGHGSHDIDNPMDLVMPGCSDLRPTLPGRAVVT